jgi:BCD family chlorophyll transporter-like MFS transporter
VIISRQRFIASVQGASTRWLPFADAASIELSMPRLLRLALFQVSVAISVVLLTGTLNRIMVVELAQPAWLVSLMVAIPLLLAPVRTLIGYRSDHHRSYLGWRRVPYLWFGTLMQFGGLAIMPFALIVMTEPHNGPAFVGPAAAMLAFVLVGAGLHTTQTAGLALATDLAAAETRSKVVALLYISLLVGTIIASLGFAWLLTDFNYIRLIKVLQGAAMVTVVLNLVALWKQEPRRPDLTHHNQVRPKFRTAWRQFSERGRTSRLLVGLGVGTMGFSMQDILLEPYGAEILQMSVSETTSLTAVWALGMLIAFIVSARLVSDSRDPIRVAAAGCVIGVFAFATVILAAPINSVLLFYIGVFGIGLGSGFFAVGTLTAVMALGKGSQAGLALGAWGAVSATATGVAVFAGGALRDLFATLSLSGAIDPLLDDAVAAYGAVYHLEILLLFISLIAIGPVVRKAWQQPEKNEPFGLADFPA